MGAMFAVLLAAGVERWDLTCSSALEDARLRMAKHDPVFFTAHVQDMIPDPVAGSQWLALLNGLYVTARTSNCVK